VKVATVSRCEAVRVARPAPLGGTAPASVPSWMAKRVDNQVHAMDMETNQVLCPVGEADIAIEYLDVAWDNYRSPDRCLECARLVI